MRLWTLHPRYLDRQGLVALWREALLARAVLGGRTRGYTRHPQLDRFRAHPAPRRAISAYLAGVYTEATARGYRFDRSKIGPLHTVAKIQATTGQLAHEWLHLAAKLRARNPEHLARLGAQPDPEPNGDPPDARSLEADWPDRRRLDAGWPDGRLPECHPLFVAVPGPVAEWERRTDAEIARLDRRPTRPRAAARDAASRRR